MNQSFLSLIKRAWQKEEREKSTAVYLGQPCRPEFSNISALKYVFKKLFSVVENVDGHNRYISSLSSGVWTCFEIKRAYLRLSALLIILAWKTSTQQGKRQEWVSTAGDAYHRTLRTAVLEAAGSFFVETVVGAGGFGHFLHDHLRLHILFCSGVYCNVGPLKHHESFILILRQTGKYLQLLSWFMCAPPNSLLTCFVCWYDMNDIDTPPTKLLHYSTNACSMLHGIFFIVLYFMSCSKLSLTCNSAHKHL